MEVTARSGEETKSSSGAWWLILVILSPIVYALSVGPALLIHPHLPEFGQDVVETVYEPLVYLEKIDPFKRILRLYASFWK